MNRQERALELNEWAKTEPGINRIQDIYRQKCPKADRGGLPTAALMIDGILNVEYPPQPPGFLAKSEPARR
jgi:hypothetical protein